MRGVLSASASTRQTLPVSSPPVLVILSLSGVQMERWSRGQVSKALDYAAMRPKTCSGAAISDIQREDGDELDQEFARRQFYFDCSELRS